MTLYDLYPNCNKVKLSVAALQGATRELQQNVSAPTLATCLGGVKFIMGFLRVKFTPKMGWLSFMM